MFDQLVQDDKTMNPRSSHRPPITRAYSRHSFGAHMRAKAENTKESDRMQVETLTPHQQQHARRHFAP